MAASSPGKSPSFSISESEERAADSKKYMTGRYDFKVMRRLTAIENKFLEKLCGLYGVDDEDALPDEIQQLSLSELVDTGKSVDEVRGKVEAQLTLRPWPGMDTAAMATTRDELAAALEPVISSIRKSNAEARRSSGMD